MTNQQIYGEYNIQSADTNLICEKLGLPAGDHSDSDVVQIRSVYSEARKSSLNLKKYLASISIQVEAQAPSQASAPRVSHIQAPTDDSAVGDLHLTVRNTLSSIVSGSVQTLTALDNQLADHEVAVSTAIVARLKQSKGRTARLVISGLEHEDTTFFQLAPSGAVESFAEQAARILALPSGAPQYEQPVLSQATVMVQENDKGTQRSGG